MYTCTLQCNAMQTYVMQDLNVTFHNTSKHRYLFISLQYVPKGDISIPLLTNPVFTKLNLHFTYKRGKNIEKLTKSPELSNCNNAILFAYNGKFVRVKQRVNTLSI